MDDNVNDQLFRLFPWQLRKEFVTLRHILRPKVMNWLALFISISIVVAVALIFGRGEPDEMTETRQQEKKKKRKPDVIIRTKGQIGLPPFY